MDKVEKYLRKRTEIIGILEDASFDYETEHCIHNVSMDFWSARDAAEKILSKLGINKPNILTAKECAGYAITSIKALKTQTNG